MKMCFHEFARTAWARHSREFHQWTRWEQWDRPGKKKKSTQSFLPAITLFLCSACLYKITSFSAKTTTTTTTESNTRDRSQYPEKSPAYKSNTFPCHKLQMSAHIHFFDLFFENRKRHCLNSPEPCWQGHQAKVLSWKTKKQQDGISQTHAESTSVLLYA